MADECRFCPFTPDPRNGGIHGSRWSRGEDAPRALPSPEPSCELTTFLRAIADANSLLMGIIDRIDFNATTHGQRDIDDLRLSNLIEAISGKRLGLKDVEPDIIGRSYEYLIRKFAEGGGQSAGEFYTLAEVGLVMARAMEPESGMEVYDPTCGSAGLLIKVELVLAEKKESRREKEIHPRETLRSGVHRHDLGDGEHEHDHPRHTARSFWQTTSRMFPPICRRISATGLRKWAGPATNRCRRAPTCAR